MVFLFIVTPTEAGAHARCIVDAARGVDTGLRRYDEVFRAYLYS
jgi:hypothetical protein